MIGRCDRFPELDKGAVRFHFAAMAHHAPFIPFAASPAEAATPRAAVYYAYVTARTGPA